MLFTFHVFGGEWVSLLILQFEQPGNVKCGEIANILVKDINPLVPDVH